jgi:hypothetical protein
LRANQFVGVRVGYGLTVGVVTRKRGVCVGVTLGITVLVPVIVGVAVRVGVLLGVKVHVG